MGIAAIYQGPGTAELSVRAAYESFSALSSHKVQLIEGDYFDSPNWEAATSLVVIPGGRDLPYVEELAGARNLRIRKFVENGGWYVGFCAGAYFGSGYVEFDKAHDLEVLGDRELKFFEGKAIGPAYGAGTYKYNTNSGARVAELTMGDLEAPPAGKFLKVYYDGGCYFEEPVDKNVYVALRYHNIEGTPPAVIVVKVGRGAALLSGVHIEYSTELLIDACSSDFNENLIEELKEYDGARREVLRELYSLIDSK